MHKTIRYFLSILLLSFLQVAVAQPMASFTMDDSVKCSGETVSFTNNSSGATSYKWRVDNQTISNASTATFRVSGVNTYVVTLIAYESSTVSDTACMTLRSLVPPVYDFSFDQSFSSGIFCLGSEMTMSAWSTFEGVDSVLWNFGDGNTSNKRFPRHTYKNAGTYTVTADVFGRCGTNSKSVTAQVVTDERAKPVVFLNAPSVACPGEPIYLSMYDQSGGIMDEAYVETGDGNMTNLRDFEYTFKAEGIYKLKAFGKNVCGQDSFVSEVNVSSSAPKSFSLNAYPATVCLGQIVNVGMFLVNSSYAVVDFGNGMSDTLTSQKQNIQYMYSSAGTYTIKANVFPDCGMATQVERTITVDNSLRPNAYSLYVSATRICPGERILVSSPYLQKGDTFDISFGDGNSTKLFDSAQQFDYTYSNTGFFTIRSTLTNVCGNTRSSNSFVRVNSTQGMAPYISSSFEEGHAVCPNDSISFYVFGNNFREIKSASWAFNDGLEFQGMSVKRTFTKMGETKVVCTITDFCDASYKIAYSADVSSQLKAPKAMFWVQPPSGCEQTDVLLDQLSMNAQDLTWNFGDGTIRPAELTHVHEFHQYAKAGTYVMSLEAKNGCGTDTHKVSFTVEPGPGINVSASSNWINLGDTVFFTSDASGEYWFEGLRPGNSVSREQNPVFVPTKTGTYTILFKALTPFGCEQIEQYEITVGGVGIGPIVEGRESFRLFPNPAHSYINVQGLNTIATDNEVNFTLRDINGRKVLEQILQMSEAPVRVELIEYGIQPGLYFAILTDEGKLYSKPILIK